MEGKKEEARREEVERASLYNVACLHIYWCAIINNPLSV